MAPKTALVILAPGFEPIEAITTIDVLRRAGIQVKVASLNPDVVVEGGVNVVVKADQSLAEASSSTYDMIMLPGGAEGSRLLGESSVVVDMIRKQLSDPNKYVAAICAAPYDVLYKHGMMKNEYKFTCYPGYDVDKSLYEDKPVVVSKNLGNEHLLFKKRIAVHAVTGQGPASCMAFALKLVEVLLDAETKNSIAQRLLYH